MRFVTKFAIALVGWNFLPPADAPAGAPIIPAGQNLPPVVWDGDEPIWCAEGPKIRIAGVAAREIDETCRPDRPCPAVGGAVARDRLVDV
jgi:endonuclease YncB( thermonuclease family)